MRILKYIFLLLLLSLVALSIFVATQKGEFTIERSKIINSPKSTIYSYINDSKNWREWNSWAVEDSLLYVTYLQNASTKNQIISWEGKDNNGDIETLKSVSNDSISQIMNFNGNSAEVSLLLKDTLKGTKISWKANVKLGFVNKIIATFNGNIEDEVSSMFEKSLTNLDRRLDYEINTYRINTIAVSIRSECFYLEQTFTSEFSKVRKNSEIVFNKITTFCKQNKIIISGKPFLIYHNYDLERQLTKISICIPIKEEIFITEGSEFLCKKLRSQPVIKATISGDYSHIKIALEKVNAYIREKKYIKNTVYSHFEIFVLDKTKTINPSKWITEIQIPVHPKGISKLSNTTQEIIQDSTTEALNSEKKISSKLN
jgi:effector-binding domain-containing protein